LLGLLVEVGSSIKMSEVEQDSKIKIAVVKCLAKKYQKVILFCIIDVWPLKGPFG
jgi:hypothetical protein